MSTLKTANIQDTSGGNNSTPEEINQGRAKAWVNFNGTGTVAIRDSFNVSSITDNGTGDYTVNFTTAMSSASYVPLVMTICNSGQTGATSPPGVRSTAHTAPNQSITTSDVRFIHRPANNNVDADMYGLAIFGD